MKLKGYVEKLRPDPSKKTGSYQDSLIRVTKAGTIMTVIFFTGFALTYWLGGYPRFAVWVNLAAVLCSIVGYILNKRFGKYRTTAHLVTFAIYLSSTGVMVISGGINSSSAIWQVFVPIAAFIMAGLWAGFRWGVVSFLTVLACYMLDATGTTLFVGFQTTPTDRLIDLAGAIFAVSIAIWYSDSIKSRAFIDLEEAKVQLNYHATVDPLTNTFNRRHFL